MNDEKNLRMTPESLRKFFIKTFEGVHFQQTFRYSPTSNSTKDEPLNYVLSFMFVVSVAAS